MGNLLVPPGRDELNRKISIKEECACMSKTFNGCGLYAHMGYQPQHRREVNISPVTGRGWFSGR